MSTIYAPTFYLVKLYNFRGYIFSYLRVIGKYYPTSIICSVRRLMIEINYGVFINSAPNFTPLSFISTFWIKEINILLIQNLQSDRAYKLKLVWRYTV